ncbi:MAG: hypothetical protein ACW9XA_09645 [Candidatus Nitrosopumilus sp. bin_6a]
MKLIFLFLFLVLFTSLLSSTALGSIDSPRKQMANGISAEDVLCKNELQLMIRGNGDAICVKLSSVERWVDSKIAVIADVSFSDSENNDDTSSNEIQMDSDISPEIILVQSARDSYTLGSTMVFTGEVKPDTNLEISLEDSDGNEVYVDILDIDDSGYLYLEIKSDDTFTQGAYFLILKQEDDSEIVPIHIGEPTGDIAAVFEKFHNDLNSETSIEIFGPVSSDISMTILDSRDNVRFEETILLDSTGYAEYLLDLSGYKKGNYYLVLNHASEETVEEFTVGLSIGTATIEIQLDDNYYSTGETVILFGKSSPFFQILIELIDPAGKVVDIVEYYTDKDGKFTRPLEIPLEKQSGVWTVQVSNGERVSKVSFEVVSNKKNLTIQLDKEEPYTHGEFVTISGTGIDSESQTIIQIQSSDKFFELTPDATNDGAFSEVWQVPENLAAGTYTVLVDDGINKATTKLQIISKNKL